MFMLFLSAVALDSWIKFIHLVSQEANTKTVKEQFDYS